MRVIRDADVQCKTEKHEIETPGPILSHVALRDIAREGVHGNRRGICASSMDLPAVAPSDVWLMVVRDQ